MYCDDRVYLLYKGVLLNGQEISKAPIDLCFFAIRGFVLSPSSSTGSFHLLTFHIFPVSEPAHSSNDGAAWDCVPPGPSQMPSGIYPLCRSCQVGTEEPPRAHRSDWTVPQLLLDLGRNMTLYSAIVIDLLVFVLHLHCCIKIDNFQAIVIVKNKVGRLNIPVGDTVPVKKCDTFDESKADLGNLAFKSFRRQITRSLTETNLGRMADP
jgi:hypothetical protein